jgi:hypothetical protein
MAFSLNPQTNPILLVYELFRQTGLQCLDRAEFFGFSNLKLQSVSGVAAEALIGLLRQTPSAISLCRLKLDRRHLIDFAPVSPSDWIDRITIDQLATDALCKTCWEALLQSRDDLDAFGAGAQWPGTDIVADTLHLVRVLGDCETCGERFELDVRLDKSILTDKYLLEGLPNLTENVSALLWHDSERLAKAFDTFDGFLRFVSKQAEKPIVLFLYEPEGSYSGDYLKIISLSDLSGSIAERESQLAQSLSGLSVQTFDDYRLLRRKHANEDRPIERLDLPPTLFLQRKDALAQYPAHRLFEGGPLRYVLLYAILAWLAKKSRLVNQSGEFNFKSNPSQSNDLCLRFSFSDVQVEGASIFETDVDWRVVMALAGREIGMSAGNHKLRKQWTAALDCHLTANLPSSQFFKTLETVYREFVNIKEEAAKEVTPLASSQLSAELIVKTTRENQAVVDVLVFLDAEHQEIKFQLNSGSLGYVYEQVGQIRLGGSDPDLRVAELSELARDQLGRILIPDITRRAGAQVPSVDKLKTRGVELWRKLIPDDLKRAYLKLRAQPELTIFIVSDDPSFPWELVKPLELKGKISNTDVEDLWWAMTFSIGRWLSGSRPPANDLALTRICCVVTEKQLAAAGRERDCLKAIGAVDFPQTYSELFESLGTKDYDVIHFACHGDFDTDQPGESVIMLPDGTKLQPADFLTQPVMSRFNDNQPLIFLNSCNSARTGPTLIGVAGWAEEFIKMGCGAFVGCGWEVDDLLAADFAIAFYEAFRNGQTLGKSVHQARLQIKQKDESNSTWLAYYLYGNPNCILRTETQAPTENN